MAITKEIRLKIYKILLGSIFGGVGLTIAYFYPPTLKISIHEYYWFLSKGHMIEYFYLRLFIFGFFIGIVEGIIYKSIKNTLSGGIILGFVSVLISIAINFINRSVGEGIFLSFLYIPFVIGGLMVLGIYLNEIMVIKKKDIEVSSILSKIIVSSLVTIFIFLFGDLWNIFSSESTVIIRNILQGATIGVGCYLIDLKGK